MPGCSCTGVWCRPALRLLPWATMVTAVAVLFCALGGAAVGPEVMRMVDLGVLVVFWGQAQVLDHGGTGRVPGRRTSTAFIFSPSWVGCYCGSPQSFQAMVPPVVLGCGLLRLPGFGVVFYGTSSWHWRPPASQSGRQGSSRSFVVFFLFWGAPLQVRLGQLGSVSNAYVCTSLYGCLVCFP